MEFSPYVARKFTEICYVELEGHVERQPVTLTGQGLGPCAIFTYDVLDIGNAYINTLYRYSVQLENRGDIPAPFAIQPGDGEFGSMFAFVPSDGVVPAETTLDIEVELLASHIGRLEERVLVDVAGMDSPLSLQFKGRIVGPTFDIDVDTLDFGMVAYGFRCACSCYLVFVCCLAPLSYVLHWKCVPSPCVSSTNVRYAGTARIGRCTTAVKYRCSSAGGWTMEPYQQMNSTSSPVPEPFFQGCTNSSLRSSFPATSQNTTHR